MAESSDTITLNQRQTQVLRDLMALVEVDNIDTFFAGLELILPYWKLKVEEVCVMEVLSSLDKTRE